MQVAWRRQSSWSVRLYRRLADAAGEAQSPYAVSRSVGLILETGELAPRFSAWNGWPLEPGRRDIPFPELLGVYEEADQAKAVCLAHCRERYEVCNA
jgi:hypothetical protein